MPTTTSAPRTSAPRASTSASAPSGAATGGSGFGNVIGSGFGKLSKGLMYAQMGGWLTGLLGGWLGKKERSWVPNGTAGALNKVSEVAGLTNQSLGSVADETAKVLGSSSAVVGAVKQVSDTVGHYAQKTLGSKITDRLAKNPLNTTIFSTSMMVGETMSTVFDFKTRLAAIKGMQKALTGKDITSASAMTGKNLHPLVKSVSSELTGWKATLGTLLQTGGVLANGYLMLFGNSESKWNVGARGIAVSLGLSMGTSMIASAVTASDTGLRAYSMMSKYNAHGKPVPVELYAQLIGGLVKNATAEAVTALATQCHEKNLSADEVIRNIAQSKYPTTAKTAASTPVTIGGKTFVSKKAQGFTAQTLRSQNPAGAVPSL